MNRLSLVLRWACLVQIAALTTPASGQVVRGRVSQAPNGAPLEGAFVALRDSAGVRRDARLTDPSGFFETRAPTPGSYSISVERIGYRTGTSEVIHLAQGDTVFITLTVQVQAIILEGLSVSTGERCSVDRDEAAQTERIWDEARKALEIASWTEDRGLYRYEIETYDRRLDVEGQRVLSDRRRPSVAWGTHPFRSSTPADLARLGYVQSSGARTAYYAPDAAALLSEAFTRTHCFEPTTDEKDHPGQIGLSFRPVDGREVPDIAGALWLDAETSELGRLEFSYTGLRRDFDTSDLGGSITFEALKDGAWIVRHWAIRMPAVGMREAWPDGPRDEVLVGIEETGGEVLQVEHSERMVLRPRPRGSLTGEVFDSTRSAPLADAIVRLTGTGYRTTTGPDGRFHMEGLAEGSYGLEVTHPLMDSLGLGGLYMSVTVGVRSSSPAIRIAIPSLGTLLRRQCEELGVNPVRGVIAGFVRDKTTAVPIAGATVRMVWDSITSLSASGFQGEEKWTQLLTDAEGRFLACELPADDLVTVYAEWQGLRSRSVDIHMGRTSPSSIILEIARPGTAEVIGAALLPEHHSPEADAARRPPPALPPLTSKRATTADPRPR